MRSWSPRIGSWGCWFLPDSSPQNQTWRAPRRFFFCPSFSIHGGVSGLFDYGPTGSAVKNNLVAAWREFFVVEDGMLEVACPAVTPEVVLAASGHVQRFTDLMVRDLVSGECFRADKLLLEACAAFPPPTPAAAAVARLANEAGEMGPEELAAALAALNVTSPTTGNALSAPYPFNLMFRTSVGPAGDAKAFLRPETSQGIFTNFKRLLDFNGGKLPFTAAQVGKAFRNEISPKQGLIRLREFEMAEVEHFVEPGDKPHPRFASIADHRLRFLSRQLQEVFFRLPSLNRAS
ncbi:hypothetical protein T484DRAFT_1631255 [Baffinella frigidus]|nr:hypothetical protein T484DRAFT_1631255 [Cryptophyta sp. CCMP2293]